MSIEQINDEKLKNENRYHSCLKDVPDLSATDMKEFFDYVSRRVIIPKINELIDDRTNIDEALEAKADADSVYTKSQADGLLTKKADKAYTYSKDEADELLSYKADVDSVYTKSESDALLTDRPTREEVLLLEEYEDCLSTYLNKYEYESPYVYDKIITDSSNYEMFYCADGEEYSGFVRTDGQIWLKQRSDGEYQQIPMSGRLFDWFVGAVECTCPDAQSLKEALVDGTFITVYLDGEEAAYFRYDKSDEFIKIVVPEIIEDYISINEWLGGRAYPLRAFISFPPDALERLTFTFRDEAARATFAERLPNEIVRISSLARRSELEDLYAYKGSMESLGYTKFSQCTENGFYECTSSYISSVTDKPDSLSTACICVVYNAVKSSARYVFIADISGNLWLRSPYSAQWMNLNYKNSHLYMYRGEIPANNDDSGLYSFANCNKNGHYDFKSASIDYITDKPEGLTRAGICSVEVSDTLGFKVQTVTDVYGNVWRRVLSSAASPDWKVVYSATL